MIDVCGYCHSRGYDLARGGAPCSRCGGTGNVGDAIQFRRDLDAQTEREKRAAALFGQMLAEDRKALAASWARIEELTVERDEFNRLHLHNADNFEEAQEGWRKANARIEELEKFKAYVHKRLDDAGIPMDPPSEHREHGCRIGGRLDIVLAANARADLFQGALAVILVACDPAVNGGSYWPAREWLCKYGEYEGDLNDEAVLAAVARAALSDSDHNAGTREQVHASQSPDVPATSGPVHILHEGLPLCGFSREVPGDWPPGHRWVRVKDGAQSTCGDCQAKVTPTTGAEPKCTGRWTPDAFVHDGPCLLHAVSVWWAGVDEPKRGPEGGK